MTPEHAVGGAIGSNGVSVQCLVGRETERGGGSVVFLLEIPILVLEIQVR